MAGTREGGIKAKAKILEKYGSNFYSNIGRKGGHNGHTGGFAYNPEFASIAGARGWYTSRKLRNGVHKGSATLGSLIKQCRQRYDAILVLPTGAKSPMRVSLSFLEILRKEFNGSYTFDDAFDRHGLN